MSDKSKWPRVVGEQFVQAWINLKELPGGMMQSYSPERGHFRFGPIPGTTSCGITTNPEDAQRWRDQGQPVMEVYATLGVEGLVMANGSPLLDYLNVPDDPPETDEWTKGFHEARRRLYRILAPQLAHGVDLPDGAKR